MSARADRDRVIGGTTQVFGIIGYPITHTWSPRLYNAAFEALHLDAVYVPFHVRPDALQPAVRAIRALDLHGLNVTIPYKEAILPFMDRLSPEADACGAVNTIEVSGRASGRRQRPRLIGHNTDGLGFLAAFHEQVAGRSGRSGWSGQSDHRIPGQRVTLLGAGGVARAIAAALAHKGIARLVLVNRTASRAEALRADLVRRFRRLKVDILPFSRLVSEIIATDVLINATPLGMAGHPPLPMPRIMRQRDTARRIVVCDVVYAPAVTSLLRAARAAGAVTVNGAGMLLHQAVLAFEIWTRRRAPLSAMRAALPVADPPRRVPRLSTRDAGTRNHGDALIRKNALIG